MKKYRIGICDSDAVYTVKFMEYINSRKNPVISAVAFTSIRAVSDYLKNNELDLILSGYSVDSKELHEIKSQCGIAGDPLPPVGGKGRSAIKSLCDSVADDPLPLVGGKGRSAIKVASRGTAGDPLPPVGGKGEVYLFGVRYIHLTTDMEEGVSKKGKSIFKFMSMEDIFLNIKEILLKNDMSPRKGAECICVFSPVGRSGKTEFAKALAANDEVRGGLYIGMEEYSGEEYGMVNILYHIKERIPDMMSVISDSVIREGNLYMLNSIGPFCDFKDLNRDDMKWFIDLLVASGRFSTIVFDIGGGVLCDYRILELFNAVYMPVMRDIKSEVKVKAFYKLLKDMDLRFIMSRIISVEVPNVTYKETEMIRTVVNVAGK